jgi:hypothetical protein
MSFAKGCPIGILVNVSFTVGTNDRKKKTKRQEKVFRKYRALLLAFIFENKK